MFTSENNIFLGKPIEGHKAAHSLCVLPCITDREKNLSEENPSSTPFERSEKQCSVIRIQ